MIWQTQMMARMTLGTTTFARIIIFVVVLAASFVFAHHLRLFEPVLLHHYDPETGMMTPTLVCTVMPFFFTKDSRCFL